jgi:REP element-mobilizing transposase RayT
MPRQARLDAPGTLHHVMIRGIERSAIFKDDQDRQDFISRTGMVAQETGTKILAWALMNNHVHLLFFSGPNMAFFGHGAEPSLLFICQKGKSRTKHFSRGTG